MKRAFLLCSTLALCSATVTYAKLPPPTPEELAKARAAQAKAAELAKREAAALAKAQDRVVEHYKQSQKGTVAAPAEDRKRASRKPRGKVERLACRTGSEDRHARIGVEVVDNKVVSFAYYSKWKPRTCSIEAARNGAYSRWEDNGAGAKVVLTDEKGTLLIDRKGSAYRFVFRDVDRERYCGMDGKINGTLTVTRGKSQCILQGVMDGHAG